MVLAISTVVEGSGQSEIGYRLFESVREVAERILHSEIIEIRNLPFLALLVSLLFLIITNNLQGTESCQKFGKRDSASCPITLTQGVLYCTSTPR